MLAVGIDLIDVDRIERSLERFGQRFLSRVFTEREQVYCNGRAAQLAARFAAKEAAGKALGTGIGDICWRDIEVLNQKSGQPKLILHGEAHKIAQEKRLDVWTVSLSHTKTQATAVVVAQQSDRTAT